MPHIPSVDVGSAVVLSGYVLIQRELTHRKRQTNQWARTKEQFGDLLQRFREISTASATDPASGTVSDIAAWATGSWNAGISDVRHLLRKTQ